MRKAFTLVELMISIAILSLLMIFLYKSYANLNLSNKIYFTEAKKLEKLENIKKTIYLDFSLSVDANITILNQDTKEDVVYFQTTHSLHRRILPYIAYIVKDKKLFRLESLRVFEKYPLASSDSFDVDYLGKVEKFRLFPSKDKEEKLYLIDLHFTNKQRIVQKIKLLNFL